MAKWGMVIDLDKCVGCQACTIACKEENSVPHGSPDEQRQRREPYWNRVLAVSVYLNALYALRRSPLCYRVPRQSNLSP